MTTQSFGAWMGDQLTGLGVGVLLGWSNRQGRLKLEMLNLLDSNDHDVDYFYASRLPEEPALGVEDIHFHIFEPRQARLQAGWLF